MECLICKCIFLKDEEVYIDSSCHRAEESIRMNPPISGKVCEPWVISQGNLPHLGFVGKLETR